MVPEVRNRDRSAKRQRHNSQNHLASCSLADPISLAGTVLTEQLPSLDVPLIPHRLANKLSTIAAATGGLLLLFSWFTIESRKRALAILAGAIICIFGLPLTIPALSKFVAVEHHALLVGTTLATLDAWIVGYMPIPFLRD